MYSNDATIQGNEGFGLLHYRDGFQSAMVCNTISSQAQVCVLSSMCVNIYINVYKYMYACKYICRFTYIHIYIHIYICMCICQHPCQWHILEVGSFSWKLTYWIPEKWETDAEFLRMRNWFKCRCEKKLHIALGPLFLSFPPSLSVVLSLSPYFSPNPPPLLSLPPSSPLSLWDFQIKCNKRSSPFKI